MRSGDRLISRGCRCRRSRPVGLHVDISDGDHEVWSILDPLSVVCCRLQTLVEARSDGRPTTTIGDVRWQAGLLASVHKATQRLQMLTANTESSRNSSDITSSSSVAVSLQRTTVSFTVDIYYHLQPSRKCLPPSPTARASTCPNSQHQPNRYRQSLAWTTNWRANGHEPSLR